jgi:peptidoglycan/xylan/chitin deacetylase (PgdA/CDA1 family)
MIRRTLNRVLEIFFILYRFSGIPWIVRKLVARKRVTILLYHNPERRFFEKHMAYLNKRYSFIPYSTLVNCYLTNNWDRIPDYALVVTFDDGWKENIELLDIIRMYEVNPTIFISTHLVNTSRKFWWTICIPGQISVLKKMTNRERIKVLHDQYDFQPEKEYPGERQALNMSEIDELKNFVEFGSHSSFHPILTSCSLEEKTDEIQQSILELEKICGKNGYSFAYPNGDYDDECIQVLKKNNITSARTIRFGWNDDKTDPYTLKIVGVSDRGSVNKFASELTGISLILQQLIKKILKN